MTLNSESSPLLRTCGLLALLFLSAGFVCQKKPEDLAPLTSIPMQSEAVSDLPAVVAAQRCENWAWAAAAEIVLRAQGVELPQNHWVMRAHGGEVCVDRRADLARVAQAVRGDFTLDDGRKVRIESRYTAGAPTSTDDVIMAVRQRRPWLLFWRGHAYVAYGVVFDEYIAPTGNKQFIIRELKLLDPYYASGEQRFVVLNREVHDLNEVDGAVQVTVSAR